MKQIVHAEREFALVIQQSQKAPRVALAYLRLMLNYLYGLEILAADKLMEVTSQVMEHGPSLRAVFLIQDEEITNRNPVTVLGRRGKLPVFLLMPSELAARHQALSKGMPNVRVCDWDQAVGLSDASLQSIVGEAFAALGIVRLPVDTGEVPDDLLKARVAERVKHINSLPTIPEMVLRITRLLRDPETTAEDLEKVLLTDPAVVYRLLRIVNSSVYAGTRGEGRWSLKEAVVRLGTKQIGAIAQQIKLINGLVRPADSRFDLRRFWEHSVGCAYIADRLYRQRLIPVGEEIHFDVYWVAALLHDIGKLVLGFLAWEYFDQVLQNMRDHDSSFQRAEERLRHEVTHEYLGRLMLLNSGTDDALAAAVGTHNGTGPHPSRLACLVHVADGLCRDLGLGYLAEERASYSSSVLLVLGMSRENLAQVQAALEPDARTEIEQLAQQCLQG